MKIGLWALGAIVILVGGLRAYNHWMLDRNVDFLFNEVLGQNDPEIAYQNGDPRFQMVTTREALRKFMAERPHYFQRDKVTALEVLWRKQKNDLFVVLKTRVEGAGGPEMVDYICRPGETRRWRLVGILPGLEDAVPTLLRQTENKE